MPGLLCLAARHKLQGIEYVRSATQPQHSATGSVSGQIRQSTVRLKVLAPIEPERFVSDVAQAEPVAYLAEAPWVWLRKSAKWWLPVLVSASFCPLSAPSMPQIYVGTWHDFHSGSIWSCLGFVCHGYLRLGCSYLRVSALTAVSVARAHKMSLLSSKLRIPCPVI